MKRNRCLEHVCTSYIFEKIGKKIEGISKDELISLSVGDTTEPLFDLVSKKFAQHAMQMASPEGYQGYPPFQGDPLLRELICSYFYSNISQDEIFISDGAKSDLTRLHFLFDQSSCVGIQNPCYPPFVETAYLFGKKVVSIPSAYEELLSTDLLSRLDILILCNPNNPLGTSYSYEQLKKLVDACLTHHVLLIIDATYGEFISDDSPKTIYAIENAKKIAIEVNSFSKSYGFTGIRLGWSVIPSELCIEGASLLQDWKRILQISFNGVSRISQKGAIAALSSEGISWMQKRVRYYLDNALLLKEALEGYNLTGGTHTPFLWVKTLHDSWKAFDKLLERRVVCTPGIGFGSLGEGYIRLSGLGCREKIKKGAQILHETAREIFSR